MQPNMQTYGIRQHRWRNARCDEVECPHYRLGWAITVDLSTELGQAQAGYIKRESGRRYHVEQLSDTVARLVFEPGQQCFAEHKLPAGDPQYVLQRGNHVRGLRVQDWLDDFQNNQDKLATIIERG